MEARDEIRKLQKRVRYLEMQLEDCKLDACGVRNYIIEADKAKAKLRELAAAAEWRDECNDLYTEMHIDWLDGKPEAPRMMDSIYEISEEAEIAYQAALAAAREER